MFADKEEPAPDDKDPGGFRGLGDTGRREGVVRGKLQKLEKWEMTLQVGALYLTAVSLLSPPLDGATGVGCLC